MKLDHGNTQNSAAIKSLIKFFDTQMITLNYKSAANLLNEIFFNHWNWSCLFLECNQPFDKGTECEPPVKGKIMAFYDTKTGKCVEFAHNGCGGNENKWPTKKICEETCVTKGKR